MPVSLRSLLVAMALLVVAVGCSGQDDQEVGSGGGTPGTTPVDCEPDVTPPEITYRATDELTDLERQTIELFRSASGPILTGPNPVSCQGLAETEPMFQAIDVDAFEVKSFSHTDPAIRYDLVYHTERQALDNARLDTLGGSAATSNGTEPTTVFTVADTMDVIVTYQPDDSTAAAIVEHYNQALAGHE